MSLDWLVGERVAFVPVGAAELVAAHFAEHSDADFAVVAAAAAAAELLLVVVAHCAEPEPGPELANAPVAGAVSVHSGSGLVGEGVN